MKWFLLTFLFLAGTLTFAQVNPHARYQTGYVKKSTGTYVQPHFKTQTNNTNHDNYSTKPNTNTYTGSKGYKAKDYSPGAYNYGKGHTISTGSKGGQYYKNSKGNKVYVPKQR